jgi:hypothetical protein
MAAADKMLIEGSKPEGAGVCSLLVCLVFPKADTRSKSAALADASSRPRELMLRVRHKECFVFHMSEHPGKSLSVFGYSKRHKKYLSITISRKPVQLWGKTRHRLQT